MTLLDRVKQLCASKGISQSKMEKEIGISNGASYKWKTSSPSMEVLEKLSNYFNVSVDFLMTGEEKSVDIMITKTDEETGEEYYLLIETARTAQRMFEEDRVLFDVYRSVDKDRLVEYAKKLKSLRDMEEGEK